MWFRNLRAVALVGATTLVLGSPCLQAAEQAGDGLHALKEHPQVGSNGLAIKVLSSRNDVISGGDALIEVSSQQPDAGTAVIRLNGVDVSKTFKSHGDAKRVSGLVTGLKNGDNLLEVSPRNSATKASLTLTNWPISGPIISGPHEKPFVCMTNEFKLPVTGDTLGAARDADCLADTRVDYVYYSTEGSFKPLPKGAPLPKDVATTKGPVPVPFIVRVETGVINRGIYQISMLHNPSATAPNPDSKPAGWNGALVYQFGGGCPGGMYIQGRNTGGVLEPEALSRGFAMASSSLNVFGNNCDDLLASETMMMVKEHFIEAYGPPAQTIGFGCSGGSFQSHQIGDNYPGLLDGILVGCSFPDVGHAAVTVHSFGARLVKDYFDKITKLPWTTEQKVAVSGLPDLIAIDTQGARSDRIDPVETCKPELPKDQIYNPATNPKGIRCSIYDHGAASFGRDPRTGFGRRPLDNVGVQYGLRSLNQGTISKEQFLDLNKRIGGVDIDAKHTETRTVADPIAMRRGYESGRFLSGGGGLATIPIIDYRAYIDLGKGDPHMRFHSFSTRERLRAANGNIDNHVMLTDSYKYGLFSLKSPHLQEALEQMNRWITAIKADTSATPAAQKVAKSRPADLVDACFTEMDEKIFERQVYEGDTRCNRLYPPHANPYIVAGAPIANDVAKCVLKPIDPKDYVKPFSAAEMKTLQSIFPDGVCDYTKKGVEQRPLMGTWLSAGPAA